MLRAVFYLVLKDCAAPFRTRNSQCCWWTILLWAEWMAAWDKITLQPFLTPFHAAHPASSFARYPMLSSYATALLHLPCLRAWQKETRRGTAGGSWAPHSTTCGEAHGNTSRRFVASFSGFHRTALPPYSETLCLLYALLILALSKLGPLSEHYYDLLAVHG